MPKSQLLAPSRRAVPITVPSNEGRQLRLQRDRVDAVRMKAFADTLRLRHESGEGRLGRVDVCGSDGFVLVEPPHVELVYRDHTGNLQGSLVQRSYGVASNSTYCFQIVLDVREIDSERDAFQKNRTAVFNCVTTLQRLTGEVNSWTYLPRGIAEARINSAMPILTPGSA